MSDELTLSSTVQWSSDQIAATVDREIVILSVERGSYYGLDEIGSEIWQQLVNPIRVGALCDALAANYDADRGTIEHDVLVLLKGLAAEGLIQVAA
ncbi:MAG TPA: PqqD family peptide modification chaperone [Stellaceae bacterium]|nr:PqqD family peptide modification chaperone [Stellaceae bacterium]